MANVSMKQLLQAGVHFGHRTRYWDPKMAPYIHGKHRGIHIINLEETLPALRNAMNLVGRIAANKGKVLFVGTKHAARDVMREEASRVGMPYVNFRWLGGMLTNWKTVRQSIRRLKELEQMMADGTLAKLSKKEALMITRDCEKLERSLGGIKNMGGIPDAIFVIDVMQEKIAVTEARRLGIPVIGIVDTNSNPDNIDYMIPGNDDASRSIRMYASSLADAIAEAQEGMTQTTTVVTEDAKVEAKKSKAKVADKKPDTAEAVDAAADATAKPASDAAEQTDGEQQQQ